MKRCPCLLLAAVLLASAALACRSRPHPPMVVERVVTAASIPLPPSVTPPGPTAPALPATAESHGEAAQSTPVPGQARLAFSMDRDGNADIYLQVKEGEPPLRLTDSPDPEAAPAWWPDGQRLAYHRKVDGRWAIYVMAADGSGQTLLMEDAAGSCFRPSWSPDGAHIAYVFSSADDRDHPRVYCMNADGSDPRPLTRAGGIAFQPVWSPDGTRIAYTGCDEDTCHIYLMAPDGGRVTQLTGGAPGEEDQWPAWSQDGTRLLFSGVRGDQQGIFVVNADGNGERLVVNEPRGRHPTWLGSRAFYYTIAAEESAWICSADADTGEVCWCAEPEPGVFALDPACWWNPAN
ncbi:MAG: hypothetical protein ACUVX9_11540 [Anaerolineae bacterium]